MAVDQEINKACHFDGFKNHSICCFLPISMCDVIFVYVITPFIIEITGHVRIVTTGQVISSIASI